MKKELLLLAHRCGLHHAAIFIGDTAAADQPSDHGPKLDHVLDSSQRIITNGSHLRVICLCISKGI